MPVNFTCDLTGTTTPITHFWEHTVGVAALNAASICQSQLQPFEIQTNIITLELTLPPQAVAAVTIEYASPLS